MASNLTTSQSSSSSSSSSGGGSLEQHQPSMEQPYPQRASGSSSSNSLADQPGPSGLQAGLFGLQPGPSGLQAGLSGLQAGPSGLQVCMKHTCMWYVLYGYLHK